MDRVLMKGNEALAEGAILAGCRGFFGYPITPSSEIAEYMARKMPKIGGVFVQAESELAAICCNDALVIVRSLMVRAELPGPIILKLTEKSSPPVLVPVEEAHTTRTAFFPAFW